MRPQVMGVVNVTPDSFSDGGRWFDPEAAIAHGRQLLSEGADIVDVGGESTRPFAQPVDSAEERRRVVPVVAALAPHGRVSIDTRHEDTAHAAIEAGATIVNDVSASLWPVAAATGAGWIAMHMLGDPRTMQEAPSYVDVVAEVLAFLVERAGRAVEAGVDEVWIDPGFGFGKDVRHNVTLLAHLDELVATGFPVVVGLSRKAAVGRLLAASDARVGHPSLPGLDDPLVLLDEATDVEPVAVDERLDGSVVAALWAVHLGAAIVRVHDVGATVRALSVMPAAA
jgi:dihydropteroate synthase